MHRRRLILGVLSCGGIWLPTAGTGLVTHAPGHRRGAGMAASSAAWRWSKRACRSPCWRPDRIGGATGRCAPETPPDLVGTNPTAAPSRQANYLNARLAHPVWHHRVLRSRAAARALHWNLWANDGPLCGEPCGPQATWMRRLRPGAGESQAPVHTALRCCASMHGHRTTQAWLAGYATAGASERLQSRLRRAGPATGRDGTVRYPPATTLRRDLPGPVQTADAIKIALETDGTWAQGVPTDVQPSVSSAQQGHWSYSALPACMAMPCPSRKVLLGPRTAQLHRPVALLRPCSPTGHWACRRPLVVQWSRMPWACGAATRLPPGAAPTLAALRGLPHFWANDALTPLNVAGRKGH